MSYEGQHLTPGMRAWMRRGECLGHALREAVDNTKQRAKHLCSAKHPVSPGKALKVNWN